MRLRRQLEIQARLLMRRWQRYLVPARVLIVSSMLALAGAVVASFSLPGLGLICVAGLALGMAASSKKLCCLWVALPLVFYANVVLRIPASNDRSQAGAFVSFEGKVIECQSGQTQQKILVQMQSCAHDSVSAAQLAGSCFMVETNKINLSHVLPGDIVLVQGRLELPRHAFYPWQFDYSNYLRYKGAAYICRAVFVQVAQHSVFYPVLKTFEDVRIKLIAMQEKLMGAQASQLLISIVLGDRAVNIAPQTEQNFREVGLGHVLAASGFNLSIVVLAARWTMRFVIRKVLWLNLLTIPCIAGYDLMAGFSPSILRASLMIMLALGVGSIFRRVHGTAVLAACAVICLLLYPGCLQDVGFQLSYLATFGIVSGARELQQIIYSGIKRLAFSKWLGEVLSIVLLAQASVLPVQLGYFWKFNLLFLPANLIVDPLLPPLTVLGFVSCLIVLPDACLSGPLSAMPVPAGAGLLFLCTCLDRICNFILQFMLSAVEYLAGHSQGVDFCTGPPQFAVTVIYFACLALFVWGLKTRRHVSLLGAMLLIAVACLLFMRSARPELVIANFRSSTALVKSDGSCMVWGDKSNRQADAFMRFCGGVQRNAEFKIDHHAGFDILLADTKQNILLVDLDAIARQSFVRDYKAGGAAYPACRLPFLYERIPRCAAAVVCNSCAKSTAHEYRAAAAYYLSQLAAACHAEEVLLNEPDSRWLSRCPRFCRNLPSTQIILPRGGCNVAALMHDGSLAPWPHGHRIELTND